MTHPYTKLAKELDITTQWLGSGLAATPKDIANVSEAARILRSAAAVDVKALITIVQDFGSARWAEGFDEKNKPHGESALHKKVALKKLAELESALRLALAAREWQPIETAPKDVAVLLWGKYWNNKDVFQRPLVGQWNPISNPQRWEALGEYRFGIRPTHWMPLPAAPKGTP